MTYEQSGSALQQSPTRIRPYRRILVPLDGTPFGEAAIRPAAQLASRCGASLHLATVVEDVGDGTRMVWPEPKPPNGVTPSVRRAEELENSLKGVRDRIRVEWGCPVSFEVLSEAPTSRALVDYADRLDADLIVAATHSRGLIARTLLGSTAADLVHRAPCPVLLVPAEESGPDPARTPLQGPVHHVLAALDPGAGAGDPVLAHSIANATLWEADLLVTEVVVTILASSPGPGGWAAVSFVPALAMDEKGLEMAEARLEKNAELVRRQGVECRSDVLRGRDAAHAVFERVGSGNIDLVVVGAHDKGFLERLWSGDQADKLAKLVRTAGLMIVPLDS